MCCVGDLNVALHKLKCNCLDLSVFFYDTALWCNFTSSAMNKLASSYCKCNKIFFNVDKYSSVTTYDVTKLGLVKFQHLI